MTDSTFHNVSLLLDDFVAASDQNVSDRLLTELIALRVEPLIRTLIRGKLHLTLQPDDERLINQDALDLVSEIKTLIVAKLRSIKPANEVGRIDDLEAYVRTVAANATNHYFRRKHPNRLRLKNQLRYLLTHDRRFSLWATERDNWVCGNREWQINSPEAKYVKSAANLTEELRLTFAKDGISPDRIELVDLVQRVFVHFGSPLRFVDLVAVGYDLRRVSEPVNVIVDEAGSHRSLEYESDLLDRLEQTAFLKSLWDEIGRLPLRHRAALLLNLKNSQGDGLITLLPLTRIATIGQIAEMLEFPLDDFARIWSDLPWDDRTIAEHLGLTRQQVINLRQSARSTLKRRLDRV